MTGDATDGDRTTGGAPADVTRRATLAGAAGALLAGCSGPVRTGVEGTTTRTSGTSSGASAGRVRVGLLVQEGNTGLYDYWASQSLWGFFAGLHHKGASGFEESVPPFELTVSAGGVDYELLVRETATVASRSNVGALVEDAGVDAVYGGRGWVDLLDIARGIEDAAGRAVYLAGPSGAGLSNPDLCRDWVFHTGETFGMDGRATARYLRDHGDVGRAFLVGHEYEETAMLRSYRRVLVPSEVDLVGQRILYQDVDWATVFDIATRRDADAVILGARPRKWPGAYATLLAGEYDLRLLGPAGGLPSFLDLDWAVRRAFEVPPDPEALRSAGVGPFSCRYHPTQYDNPINEAFVGFVTDATGALPDESAATAFTAASALHQAVLAVRRGEATSLPGALSGATVADTPKGSDAYTFHPDVNQARSPMTVAGPGRAPDRYREHWESDLAPTDALVRVAAGETTPDGRPAGCDS